MDLLFLKDSLYGGRGPPPVSSLVGLKLSTIIHQRDDQHGIPVL
jgi:hypothetical protein